MASIESVESLHKRIVIQVEWGKMGYSILSKSEASISNFYDLVCLVFAEANTRA